MIKANELRIGNYVGVKDKRNEYYKETFSIQDIFGISGIYTLKEGGGTFIKNRYPGIFIEPIPLTPEILKKAGFETTIEKSGLEEWNIYMIGNVIFHWRYEFLNFGWVNDVDVKYLHQLQNLYFALTGEELEISL